MRKYAKVISSLLVFWVLFAGTQSGYFIDHSAADNSSSSSYFVNGGSDLFLAPFSNESLSTAPHNQTVPHHGKYDPDQAIYLLFDLRISLLNAEYLCFARFLEPGLSIRKIIYPFHFFF